MDYRHRDLVDFYFKFLPLKQLQAHIHDIFKRGTLVKNMLLKERDCYQSRNTAVQMSGLHIRSRYLRLRFVLLCVCESLLSLA